MASTGHSFFRAPGSTPSLRPMGQKRGHFVPAFLLRRFAVENRSHGERIYRLDRRTGRCVLADPRTEAAQKHMYRIVDDDGTVCMDAESTLQQVESRTAPVLRKLEQPGVRLSTDERSVLGLFVVIQRLRTPFGRSWIKRIDEQLAVAQAEVALRNGEDFNGRHVGDDDRTELVDLLRSGNLVVESPPSRQTALMFIQWQEMARVLVDQCEWAIARAPEDSRFVTSDNPVVHFDPTLRDPRSGLGFASSAYTETTFAVDPSFCIWIRPSGVPRWGDGHVDARSVEEVNLRTYAWAQDALYATTQGVLTDLRALERRSRKRVSRYQPVEPALEIFEAGQRPAYLEEAARRLETLPPTMRPR